MAELKWLKQEKAERKICDALQRSAGKLGGEVKKSLTAANNDTITSLRDASQSEWDLRLPLHSHRNAAYKEKSGFSSNTHVNLVNSLT